MLNILLDLNKICDIASAALDIGRKIAQEHYRADFRVHLKDDHTPVTSVDLLIEQQLKEYLTQNMPNSLFLGEETGYSDHDHADDNRLFWCLDPIDGTRSFLSGYPIFCILLALYHNKKPILGAIDSPITSERWLAYNGRTLFNGDKNCFSSAVSQLDESLLAATTPEMFDLEEMRLFKSLASLVKSLRWGGDAYNYGCLASGFVDLVVESDLKFHDIAALIPVIENSGGVITDWQGQPLAFRGSGRVLAAANHKLHRQALAALAD